jgi:hypothetical protein
LNFTKRMFLIALAVSSASLNMNGTTLTGAVGFSADSAGNYGAGVVSTSVCCQGFFLSQGSTGGAFVVNAQTSDLGLTLDPGTYSFYGFTNNFGVDRGALNLFFNANGSNPGISVFALPTNDSTIFPAFAADSGTSTPNLSFSLVPASGSLTYNDGINTVTLTNFQWTNSGAYNLDRVGPNSVGTDGTLDTVVRFDLSVVSNSAEAVPEPASIMLLGGGLAAIFFVRRKSHDRKGAN